LSFITHQPATSAAAVPPLRSAQPAKKTSAAEVQLM